ncbi:unnamed protein product [Caenorhabditis angaria]|uniref:ZP domain-containing protein n=1 Tax=Caenorhabditis angaria TaxID=860376 RepID=A0A9P1N4M7_9PELO|nr:unnamed protein product [Caenorhabditis angaria]
MRLILLLLILVKSIELLPTSNKCNSFYIRWPRVRLNFKAVSEARLSLKACQSACSLGEDPISPGKPLECAAINHQSSPDGFSHHCDVFQPHQLQNVDGYVEADDRYTFYWKYCLSSTRKCSGEYAFTYLSDRFMDFKSIVKTTIKNSLEECLSECLDETGFECRSISFNRTDGGCHMSKDSQITRPEAIRLNNNPNFRIDYYENNCYNMSESFKFESKCLDNGISVKVNSRLPYTGALYGLYDFFTCRIEPKESNEFEYLFPSPMISKNCSDSIRFKGNEMILEVVLSTDGIEPLYFITPDDLTYQAKCPIREQQQQKVSTTTEKIVAKPIVHLDNQNKEMEASAHALFELLSKVSEEDEPALQNTFSLPLTTTTRQVITTPTTTTKKPVTTTRKPTTTTKKPAPTTTRQVSTTPKSTTTKKPVTTTHVAIIVAKDAPTTRAKLFTTKHPHTQKIEVPTTTSTTTSTTTPRPPPPPTTTVPSTTSTVPPTTTSTVPSTTSTVPSTTSTSTVPSTTSTSTVPPTTTSTVPSTTSTVAPTSTSTQKPSNNSSMPSVAGKPKTAVNFDIFHNGQPVEAVVVGTKITLSFIPHYPIPPEYISVRGCQVEPIDPKYDWEHEPLFIIRDGCPADGVGLVCPPTQSEYGAKISVEAFRYQTTGQVQYSCLVRICPFAPCPKSNCEDVEGCDSNYMHRYRRELSLDDIRRALEANPELASQIGISPNAFTTTKGSNKHFTSVVQEQQRISIGGDHVVRRRLVVVNSEDQLRYYVRTGDIL